MKIRDYFSNDFETGEEQAIPSLKTHYYRGRYEDAKETVLELVRAERGTVKAVLEQFHEIAFVCPAYSATVTIIPTHIGEVAIDIKVTTYKVLPWLAGKKIIEKLYKQLDSQLTFKGVSLYRG